MANEFIIKKGFISKADSIVSGSLIVTEGSSGSFSGSFEGDGSQLTNLPVEVSSSYALTASYVETSQTASYVLNAVSSSYAVTSSFAQSGGGIFSGSFSGSFEGDGSGLENLPSSTPFPFTGDAQITGSLTISGSFIPHGNGPTSNVIIGNLAGENIAASALYNVMIGEEAGQAQVSGDNNIMIGRKTGEASTNDNNCILIGFRAGGQSTLGNDNIYIGYDAGSTSTATHGNIGIGSTALYTSNAGGGSGYNTAIGRAAGYSITSGIYNLFLGDYAGYDITSGVSNIIIGSGSLGETGTTNQLRIGHADLHIISGSLTTGDIIFPSTASAAYFSGDGSQLTNLPASSTFPFTGDAEISGSLTVMSGSSNSITGITLINPTSPGSTQDTGAGIKMFNYTGATGSIHVKDYTSGGLNPYHPAMVFNSSDAFYFVGADEARDGTWFTAARGLMRFDMDYISTSAAEWIMTNANGGSSYARLVIGQGSGVPTHGWFFQNNGSTTDLKIGETTGAGGSGTYTNRILLSTTRMQIGDSSNDLNLSVSGSITSNNTASAAYFVGDGSQLTNIPAGVSSSYADTASFAQSGDGIFSGSFSGSFEGDGSGLTGIIHTSASYALTASYVNPLNQNVSATGDISSSAGLYGKDLFLGTTARIQTPGNSVLFLNDINASSVDISGSTIQATGNISSSATVYGNTGSFNYLLNNNGILSGSFSGSFEGDGFGLTDVPVTITNTLWVSATGNDTTAIKGNLQRPWASVSASVAVAVSGDSVIMEPGTYIESPFTLTAGVTLKTLGGLKSTTVSASNNSAIFITQEENSRLEGFTLVCPSGSFPGISYDNIGTGTIYDVTLKGQGNSIGFQIDETSTTSKVIYNEIRYGGGDFDKLIYVKGGIFACDGVHIPGGGNIDKIYHIEAGRLQAINTNAGNPNVSSSFYMEGGTSVILGTNLFNVQEAFHVAGQPYTIQAMNVYVDDNVDKHLTVDAGISGSDSQINFVAAHMEAAKITATPDFVGSDHAFTFQDDGVTLKPAFRVYSDLEVGHANKGFTFGAGEGLPYNKGMEVWASGSGGVSQSLTVEATSKDGSTFDFAYSASGDMMYFGNKQKSPSIADQFLYFTGLEYKQISTGSLAFGDLTLEIFTTASTWVAIDGAQVISSLEGYNYANNIFSHENSEEEIIANVKNNIWATSSIFGIDARWGRIRLLNPITTSPIFEQFIYTPNSTIVNPKGQLSFRGKGLTRTTYPIAGNTWGDDGLANPQLNNIGGDATWDHKIMNTRLNSAGDTAYNQISIPAGVCTAFPMNIQITYRTNQAITANVDVAIVQKTGVLVNNPAGGKVPIARTVANTVDFDNASVPITNFSAAIPDTNNTIEVVEHEGVDISSYYEGDLILIRVLNGSGVGNLDIIDTNLTFVKWALGERTV